MRRSGENRQIAKPVTALPKADTTTITYPAPDARIPGWGWAPGLALVAAFGLVLIALADTGARDRVSWAELVFWLGLLIMVVPYAVRLFLPGASRPERIALVAMLGIALYLVKVLQNPLSFTYFDEFAHWRAANDILLSHHLFQPDPLERVDPLYPGLEIVTTALASVSGLSIFGAGVVVIGAARLVLMLSLFLLYEEIITSSRVAGIAALLYMTNPNFLFFDAQFAYESLALPLVALTLFAAARGMAMPRRQRLDVGLVAVLGVGAVVITHHLTSYALAVYFFLWAAVALIVRPRRWTWTWPLGLGFITAAAVGIWFATASAAVLTYLEPPLSGAVSGLLVLVRHHKGLHHPNQTYTGVPAPLWEQVTSYGSVFLILLALPVGLVQLWRRYRSSVLALVLSVIALTYPTSLALRLTQGGVETSNRASEFVYLGVGLVLAILAVELWRDRPRSRLVIGFSGYVALLVVGGIVVGWSSVARLPGPYLVGADSRSVNPQSVVAAYWSAAYLGPGNRILTDRGNRPIMGSYGRQDPQIGASNGFPVSRLWFTFQLGPIERTILHGDAIHYLVIDRRLATALPQVGVYVDGDEPGANRHTRPIPRQALRKFNRPRLGRVYDNGTILIYDVGYLSGCSRAVGRVDRCSPGDPTGVVRPSP